MDEQRKRNREHMNTEGIVQEIILSATQGPSETEPRCHNEASNHSYRHRELDGRCQYSYHSSGRRVHQHTDIGCVRATAYVLLGNPAILRGSLTGSSGVVRRLYHGEQASHQCLESARQTRQGHEQRSSLYGTARRIMIATLILKISFFLSSTLLVLPCSQVGLRILK